jgi:hypothetical protein
VGTEDRPRPAVKARANGATHATYPRLSCHERAIHGGPGWSPADNHGQRHGGLDLRRSLPSQVTDQPDLALQAGDQSSGWPSALPSRLSAVIRATTFLLFSSARLTSIKAETNIANATAKMITYRISGMGQFSKNENLTS